MSGRGTVWWVGLASAVAALAAAWLLFGAPGPTAAVPAPGVVADPLEARAPGVRSGSAAPAAAASDARVAPASVAPPAPAPVADSARAAAAPQVPSAAELGALQAGLHGQLTTCFEAAAARTPPATGTVVLAFTLVRRQGFGRLQNPRIEADSVGDPRFARCLLAQTPEADFPAEGEDGEVAVRLPIVLRGNPRVAAVPEAASASSAPGAHAGEVTPVSTDTPPAEVAGEEDP